MLGPIKYGKDGEQQKQRYCDSYSGRYYDVFLFRFIASSMDLQNFECPEVGKMTPIQQW